MSVVVSFRVVGLFCYFENLELDDVDPGSTVEAVMDSISQKMPAFQYTGAPTSSGKKIVDSISYDFSDHSRTPYNTSGRPTNGYRDLENNIANTPSTVWQYYRSVTGDINGDPYEIKIISPGQPSYATQPLDNDLTIPSSFNLHTFNLTWRLVTIQLTPENQMLFHSAKMEAMKIRAGY